MTAPLPARAPSSAEREHAIAVLSAGFTDGRISIKEFERRVAGVYTVATLDGVERFVQDLPDTTGAIPHASATPRRTERPYDVGRPDPMPLRGQIRAIFSSSERHGSMLVPPQLDVAATFGNVEIDLRAATFRPGLTEIHVGCAFGNVEFTVPQGVHVEIEGRAFLANFSSNRSDAEFGEDAFVADVTVCVTGSAFCGNVEVHRAEDARLRLARDVRPALPDRSSY